MEVIGRRTEYEQTFANPEGTITVEQSTLPVRVRQGNSWVPVDTTLGVQSDGLVRPHASALALAFSGGGSAAPLVDLGRGVSHLRLSWPAVLPTPQLAGNAATYPEVLPGVDLVLTAEPDSFSEVLVVKSADAAQQAALKSLRFGMTVAGGTTHADGSGGFSVVDRNGAAVVISPKPLMWDSSNSTAGFGPAQGLASPPNGQSPVRGPREGDRVAPMTEQVAATNVTVSPDPTMLTSAATRFPLFLDPDVTASQHSRAMVDKSFPSTAYYGWTGPEGVGYQDFTGVSTKRLFVSFNTGAVAHKDIRSAVMSAFVTYASSCSPRAMEAWRTGAFGSGTNWTNGTASGMWVTRLATVNTAAGRSDCVPGGSSYDFNVSGAVAATAAAGGSTTYLGLKAASETDNLSWRRVRADLKLSITYNSPPPAPSPMRTTSPDTSCVRGAARPVINDPTPVLTAKLNDSDSGQAVRGDFALTVIATGAQTIVPSATAAANQEFSPSPPVGPLTNGVSYVWQARTRDPYVIGPWGAACEFTIDTSVPSPPTVTPQTAVVSPGDPPLMFTVTGAPDITQFKWSLNADAPTNNVTMTAPYTFSITPTSSGPQRVRVWGYDAAQNQTTPAVADFTVTSRSADGRWRLDENTGTTAADTATIVSPTHPSAQPMALSGSVSWRTDGRWYDPAFVPTDHALSFTGSGAGGTAATGTSPLRTSNNFTVMAALRPAVSANKQVAISEDGAVIGGATQSGFTLGANSVSLNAADNTLTASWVLSIPQPVTGAALALTCQEVGIDPTAWTHLTGRYDAHYQQLELFVDGLSCGQLPMPAGTRSSIDATGALRLGRAQAAGAVASPWTGDVDEVLVWNDLLADKDIFDQSQVTH